jgi:hypothetical protein
MARTGWKPSQNYNEIRRATDARRRELVAKMRARTAQSAEAIAEAVSPVADPELRSSEMGGLLSGDAEKGANPQNQEVSFETVTTESPVDDVSAGFFDELGQGRLREESANEATRAQAQDWLGQVGLVDRAGLEIVADLLKETASLTPRTLRVQVSWPSQWPNPVLGWAARCLSGLDPEEQELRVLFLGDGRLEMRDLDSCLVPRASAARGWPPQRDASALREAMRTAFVEGRLAAGAPEALSVSCLVPCLHVEPPDSAMRWKLRWDGFLDGARKYVNRKSRGRYGLYWERYGDPGSCRPFGFIIPKISVGKRRSEEIFAIQGRIDLVIVDLSDRNLAPWNVGPAVEQAVLDVVAGLEGANGLVPPILVLVSDPAAGIAAIKSAGELIDAEIIATRVFGQTFWRGGRAGAAARMAARDPCDVVVRGAFTYEDEIVEGLLILSNKLCDSRPDTATALADAAYMLCAMARTTRPPCADGRYPEETSRWFADEATAVRDALRNEGDVAEKEAINELLRKGHEVADRLLRETPARLALKEAVEEARGGRRVVFVVDRVSDAIAGSNGQKECDLLVVHRKQTVSEIESWHPDVLTLACRGGDALRILLEVVKAPQEIRVLLTPHDAHIAWRSAEIALEWTEMAPVHARCRALLRQMPPRLSKVLGLAAYVRGPRKNGVQTGMNGGDGSGVDRARAEVIATLDNGETVPFARGAAVVVMRGSDPVERRARYLREGDRVVLPPQDVVDDIARDLGWAGEQAMIDDVVGRYKKAVRAWKTGPGAGVSARQISLWIRAANPAMTVPTEATIRRWLSAADHEEEATPFAPGKSDWFVAFCSVIGFGEGGSCEVARHFDVFRARLRHEGHVRTGLVERMLFDRYSATIHQGISQERIDELRRKALGFVCEITAIEKGGMWEEGGA